MPLHNIMKAGLEYQVFEHAPDIFISKLKNRRCLPREV